MITENQLNVNTHSFDGDYIIYEYSNYQNQICPSKTTKVDCNIQLASDQSRSVEVSLIIEWGPDALQKLERNNIQGVLNMDQTVLIYETSADFVPNEWTYMDDAAIVTTKVRFKFTSPYHDPNSDIVYLSNLFKSLSVTTSYYSY